ncbi:hypothetical protein OJAV_G00220370 [Oryzias javanicus]|uniref:Uncharacterized protein n=1 Tax=Oryzias javanicus TaxID=123683 RepID=A0A3S2NTW3_ORYJA|nr:hypothetical protein OJAV_G00220370 [Oryzias javanicus]
MPVVGVASKLRQPSAVSPRPVHTALPIPSAVRAATSQGCAARQQEVRPGQGVPGLSCQLSVKPEYQQERTAGGRSRAETEESKICKVSGGRPLFVLQVSACLSDSLRRFPMPQVCQSEQRRSLLNRKNFSNLGAK